MIQSYEAVFTDSWKSWICILKLHIETAYYIENQVLTRQPFIFYSRPDMFADVSKKLA